MSISALLNQSGTISNQGAQTKYAKTSFGAATTVAMRFEKTKRTISTATRDKEPIDGTVFVGPSVSVDAGDKLVFGGISYRVMVVSPIILGNGQTHHLELMVQEAVLA